MYRNYTLTILFLMTCFFDISGQENTQWKIFTADPRVTYDVAIEDSILWASTECGLVKLNIITGEKYVFNSVNSGLTVNEVMKILIDHNKTKWFGTLRGGLIEYNGIEWKVFHIGNSGLPDDYITALAEDKDGNIWVGTMGGGLAKYDRKNWKIFNRNNSAITSNYIKSITVDKNNTIWIGTNSTSPGGLFKYDGTTWEMFSERNSPLPTYVVNSLCVDTSNVLWIATSKGLVKYDGNSWKIFNMTNSAIQSNNIHNLYLTNSGELLITISIDTCYKVTQFDLKTELFSEGCFLENDDYIYNVIQGNDNCFYATNNGSLLIYDGSNWIDYTIIPSSLPYCYMRSITVDHHNNKWMISGNILMKYDDFNWSTYNIPDYKGSNFPNHQISVDSKNNFWTGIDYPLYNPSKCVLTKFNGETWEFFDQDSSFTVKNFIKVITVDKNDIVWIGTLKGLFKYDGKFTFFNIDSIAGRDLDITSLAIDNDNSLWIGTNDGVIRFFENKWSSYRQSNQSLNAIYSLAIDANNNLWIGTKAGLLKRNGIKWVNIALPESIKYYDMLMFDKKNQLWMRTSSGITKLENSSYFTYDIFNSGMPSNSLSSIAVDANNNKWIITNFALMVFNEDGILTGISNTKNIIKPNSYTLSQNYPNPFNPSTVISYQLPNFSHVILKIYDILGREVKILVDKEQPSGIYQVNFDGSGLSSGIYIYRLDAGNFSDTKKMILLR